MRTWDLPGGREFHSGPRNRRNAEGFGHHGEGERDTGEVRLRGHSADVEIAHDHIGVLAGLPAVEEIAAQAIAGDSGDEGEKEVRVFGVPAGGEGRWFPWSCVLQGAIALTGGEVIRASRGVRRDRAGLYK